MCKRTEELSEQNEAAVFKKRNQTARLEKKNSKLVTKYLSDTMRGMGTRIPRNDFWESLVGQALILIGRWYSRQPLTNH